MGKSSISGCKVREIVSKDSLEENREDKVRKQHPPTQKPAESEKQMTPFRSPRVFLLEVFHARVATLLLLTP